MDRNKNSAKKRCFANPPFLVFNAACPLSFPSAVQCNGLHTIGNLSAGQQKGLTEPQIHQAPEIFHAYIRRYPKEAYLISCGQPPQLGLILEGELHIVKEDFWGHLSLLAQLGSGALFGNPFP